MAPPWLMYSDPLLRAGLDPTAFQVCSLIWSYCRHTNGICPRGAADLALDLHLHPQTVYAAITRLLERKIVRVERRQGRQVYFPESPEAWRPLRDTKNSYPRNGDSVTGELSSGEDPTHYVHTVFSDRIDLTEREIEKAARAIPPTGTTGSGNGPQGRPAPNLPPSRETDRETAADWAVTPDHDAVAREQLAKLRELAARLAAPSVPDGIPDFDSPPAEPRRRLALVPMEDA